MARKELVFTAPDGRDKGKTFLVTEMSAYGAEMWAIHAFMALGRHGIQLPEGVDTQGLAGLSRVAMELFCKIPFAEAQELLDELFTCIQILPNKNDSSVRRSLVEDDIEEVSTRIKLRMETFKLHVGFSDAVAP
jgi:hypothetical protein